MTLDTVIMALGAFVAVLHWLQLPPEWNTPLYFIAGIIIIGLGIVVRRRGISPSVSISESPKYPERTKETFTDEEIE